MDSSIYRYIWKKSFISLTIPVKIGSINDGTIKSMTHQSFESYGSFEYFENGLLRNVIFTKLDGITLHDPEFFSNIAACYLYSEDGNTSFIEHCEQHKFHNLKGPSLINVTNNILTNQYFISGIEYTKDEYYNKLKQLKL